MTKIVRVKEDDVGFHTNVDTYELKEVFKNQVFSSTNIWYECKCSNSMLGINTDIWWRRYNIYMGNPKQVDERWCMAHHYLLVDRPDTFATTESNQSPRCIDLYSIYRFPVDK